MANTSTTSHKIWVDTDTGTYGGDYSTIKFIETRDWSDEDWHVWDNMADSERCAYAIAVCGNAMYSPFPDGNELYRTPLDMGV